MSGRSKLRMLGRTLMAAGAILLLYCAWRVWEARRFQREADRRLETRREALPTPLLVPPVLRPGDIVGRLQIQRLHLSVMVVEGDDGGELRLGAGHVPHTALPGFPGNVAIAAHRDTFFRPLRNIRPDDLIRITTPSARLLYRVESTEVVDPADMRVLRAAAHNELTLVTCYPFFYVGSAPRRFVVHARQVDGPGGPPSAL